MPPSPVVSPKLQGLHLLVVVHDAQITGTPRCWLVALSLSAKLLHHLRRCLREYFPAAPRCSLQRPEHEGQNSGVMPRPVQVPGNSSFCPLQLPPTLPYASPSPDPPTPTATADYHSRQWHCSSNTQNHRHLKGWNLVTIVKVKYTAVSH